MKFYSLEHQSLVRNWKFTYGATVTLLKKNEHCCIMDVVWTKISVKWVAGQRGHDVNTILTNYFRECIEIRLNKRFSSWRGYSVMWPKLSSCLKTCTWLFKLKIFRFFTEVKRYSSSMIQDSLARELLKNNLFAMSSDLHHITYQS